MPPVKSMGSVGNVRRFDPPQNQSPRIDSHKTSCVKIIIYCCYSALEEGTALLSTVSGMLDKSWICKYTRNWLTLSARNTTDHCMYDCRLVFAARIYCLPYVWTAVLMMFDPVAVLTIDSKRCFYSPTELWSVRCIVVAYNLPPPVVVRCMRCFSFDRSA